jgi:hypothetical protein
VQTVRRREKTLAFDGTLIYPGKKTKGGNIKKLLITSLLPVTA